MRTAIENTQQLGTSVTDDPRQHILHYSRHGEPADVVEYIGELLAPAKRASWKEYRRKWVAADAMDTVFGFPLELNLEITDHCNLKCWHCYQTVRTLKHRKIVRLETIQKIIDEGAANGLGSLVIGATDEALLHRDILQIVNRATAADIPDVWLFSNGILITPDLAEEIIKAGPTRISISVDAIERDTYAKIRGGNLDEVHRGIELLLAERDRHGKKLPIIRLTFIRQPDNSAEMATFIRYWGDRVDQIDFQTLWDATWVETLPHTTTEEIFDCSQPWKQILILANGDILPCCAEFGRHMVIGNVNSGSIKEAWHSAAMTEIRRSLIERNYTRPCINCMGHRPKWVTAPDDALVVMPQVPAEVRSQ
jgi:radical SAM protein with 4Fe4S-binding SPASM domain